MRYRVVRQDDNGNRDYLGHFDDATDAFAEKELREQFKHKQTYAVGAILEEPCTYCRGRNDHP